VAVGRSRRRRDSTDEVQGQVDELVTHVQQRTGSSEEQAPQGVATGLSRLKQRLPAPIAGQIDAFLGGQNPLGGLGGMLGR